MRTAPGRATSLASGVLDKLEAQVYYNYADHVMDNYTLRTPSGTGMMAGPMASNVDRRTLGARIKGTWRWADVQLISGIDAQTNEHRQRSATRSTPATELQETT